MKIVSLQEARARGLKRYFTGKSCPHGHVAERCVAHRCCVVCIRNTVSALEKMKNIAHVRLYELEALP